MRARTTCRLLAALLALVTLLACDRPKPAPAAGSASARSAASAPAAPLASAAAPSSSASAAASPSATPTPAPPLEPATFARLFEELSELDRHFFSTNYVSNETSYLQVAKLLEQEAQPGGAYLGVGPEQNFAYLALTRPKIAFIIDIRRQNALLHLLYKAIFDQARSRAHFVALLLGRPYQAQGDPGPGADLDSVLAHAQLAEPDRKHLEQSHAELIARIEKSYRVPLSKQDKQRLLITHRAFFVGQLDTKFELAESGRKYPPLGKILAMTTPEGKQSSFLASEQLFRRVQRLQRQHRIIPVVGDFAGDHALLAVARELERRKLSVSVFYVSNVEQYVIAPPQWKKWIRNVEALPTNQRSLFLRCYLDQGRPHPHQMKGHRTATVLQRMDYFRQRQRKRSYRSFWYVATDGLITPDD